MKTTCEWRCWRSWCCGTAAGADGLNLTGIRLVLQMQQETQELQAEVTRLREQLAGGAPPVSGPG